MIATYRITYAPRTTPVPTFTWRCQAASGLQAVERFWTDCYPLLPDLRIVDVERMPGADVGQPGKQ